MTATTRRPRRTWRWPGRSPVANSGAPRRPGRVSLKGKGADIFFGDYTPPGLAEPTPEAEPSPASAAGEEDRSATSPTAQARLQADVHAAEQDTLQAGQQESIVASKSASRQERLRN